MSFPRYDEYKDSGVDWLGEVPAHWRLVPLWSLFRRTKRTGFEDEPLLSVYRDFGVILKASRDDNFNKPSDDLAPYQLVESGDLTINKMKAWQGSVAISPHRGIVSPAYFVYEALHQEDSKYLHYLMRSPRYITAYLSVSKGIRVHQWDLDPERHSRLPVLLPARTEQTAIATFLDRETAKIDDLVTEQQNLIALLKEKRQALISHAVTKGLNPNAPMKDSGVEWLGEVPAHWEVVPLKHVGTSIIGLTYGPADVSSDGTGTLVLRASNIQAGKLAFDDCVFVTCDVPDKALVRESDILICSRNGSRALIGKNAVIDRDSAGMAFGAFMTVFRSPLNDYLRWVFNSRLFEFQSSAFMTSTINQLTTGTLNSFPVPIPPASEREAISAHLSAHMHSIDSLTAEAQGSVDLLIERRTALISAAVTGKIDVRGCVQSTSAKEYA